jgi:hypothetical protein
MGVPEDDELTFTIEANEDDTEIRLVVGSPSGRKIEQGEFITMLECYLHEVASAELFRRQTNASNH